MKIAHVTATFPPYWGGTGTVCYFNARELARLGHEIHVFTAALPDLPPIETCEGFTVHRLRPLLQIGNAPLLPGLLKISGFDLIHLHHPFIFGAELIWLISRLYRIPLVLTHHNDLIGDGMRRYLFDVYFSLSTRLIFSGVSKFLVVSIDYAAHCRLTPLFRKRWEDVIEVPNGIDTERFRPGLNGKLVRQQHNIRDDDQVVLFVGALDRAHHFKGVANLLKAFSHFRGRRVILMLAGDGDQKSQWINLADELGLSESTRFVGAVPHEQLPLYYAGADVVVLPSSPPESFGMVLIEAMACAKPVIASNIPGVRSVVNDGQEGLLANPGEVEDLIEKIQILLDDPQQRQEMGQRGRTKVEEKYALPKVTEYLEKAYLSVMSDQPYGGSI